MDVVCGAAWEDSEKREWKDRRKEASQSAVR